MQEAKLRDACRVLRNAAPQEWKEFTDAFAEYTAEAVDAVSEADAGTIMTVKGMAQVCKALSKCFATAHLPPPVTLPPQRPPIP